MRLLPYFFLSVAALFGQKITETVPLPMALNETSGLATFNGHLLTQNDSGGQPSLYEFNSQGILLNTYSIEKAKNKDWESLAQDDRFLYVGDHGNNKASRKDLKIYKIQWNETFFETIGEIRFRYGLQERFEKRNRNAFDAEGLVALGNVLLLFSKNRLTQNTEVYQIPKVLGDYELYPKTVVSVNSLITGADYDQKSKVLALTGYSFDGIQYLYRVKNFDAATLNFERLEKVEIPYPNAQIEAVKVIDAQHFWVTSEEEQTYHQPVLLKIDWQ